MKPRVPALLAGLLVGTTLLAGCVSDGPVYDSPDVVVVDRYPDRPRYDPRDRYDDDRRYGDDERFERRRDRYARYDEYGRRDYRRDIHGRNVDRRTEFCRQFPGHEDCFGRRY